MTEVELDMHGVNLCQKLGQPPTRTTVGIFVYEEDGVIKIRGDRESMRTLAEGIIDKLD
jgi:hypothetical protein